MQLKSWTQLNHCLLMARNFLQKENNLSVLYIFLNMSAYRQRFYTNMDINTTTSQSVCQRKSGNPPSECELFFRLVGTKNGH